ncbi:MAG: hypothetical protein KIT36_03330 [Alphaproteobacteria bacterium]|nr:hypothetical protein [Alphaproteobacteria bacterium]
MAVFRALRGGRPVATVAPPVVVRDPDFDAGKGEALGPPLAARRAKRSTVETIGKGRRATTERGRVPAVAGWAFSQLVLTRAGYRTAFFDNLLQTMRLQFPDQDVQGTIVGAKEIGSLAFVEAHLVLRRGAPCPSSRS